MATLQIPRKFIFSDGETHDATLSEASEALTNCANYVWIIEPIYDVIDGLPLYTIECRSSDDGIWRKYNNESTTVSIEDAVDDNHLSPTQLRIVYSNGGATTGTIEFLLTQKYN